jgi:excisionase family DNA binding protein
VQTSAKSGASNLPQWLTETEVAAWLRVTRRTLARRRQAGEEPGHLAHLGPDGRQWLYRRDQLEEWLESRRWRPEPTVSDEDGL